MLDKTLSDRDICTKFINPTQIQAGFDTKKQFLEENSSPNGKIYSCGKPNLRETPPHGIQTLPIKPNFPSLLTATKHDCKNIGNSDSVSEIFTDIYAKHSKNKEQKYV